MMNANSTQEKCGTNKVLQIATLVLNQGWNFII